MSADERESAGGGIPRRDPGTAAPLSFAQRRLWIQSQLDPGALDAYVVTRRLVLKGPLDRDALLWSLQEVIRRHEILRMRIELAEGEAVQVIDALERFAPDFTDLTAPGNAADREQLRAAIEQQMHRPFDLHAGGLIRVHLLQHAPEEFELLVNVHHIVADGWSMSLLMSELCALYEARLRGRTVSLPELEIQYGDYALWERQGFKAQRLEKPLRYWRKQLAGAPALLQLPTDHPRPAVRRAGGARVYVELPERIVSALAQLAHTEGATLFMAMLAAFKLLLARWSGQRDIVVGSPISTRTQRQTQAQALIGLFLNTLVLRCEIKMPESFRSLLGRVKETALDAYEHQDMPFERLVEDLQPERDPARHPLFQVMLVLANVPRETVLLPALEVRAIETEPAAAMFDLTVFIQEMATGWRAALEYATDLFDRETIERMAEQWRVLLEAIVANPDAAVGELPLLGKEERERVLVEWNRTERMYPRERCVQELISEQAQRTPDAVALVYEDQQLTYGELEWRSNQLARYLIELGVGPEVIVGICMQRSPELVIALLGVWKAGGAWLPLDPTHPRERLGFMLEDAGVGLLVTQERLLKRLPEHLLPRLCLDADWERITKHGGETIVPNRARAGNLAYAIYTSGSTGAPKCVAAVHSALMNRLSAQPQISESTPGEVCCFKTAISFVDVVAEIFQPLMSGSTLIIAPEQTAADPTLLMALIERQRITRLITVPTLARMLVEQRDSTMRLASLRTWILSGEVATPQLVGTLQKIVPSCRIVNVYGSSEVGADATFHACSEVEPHTVPIGHPLGNVRVFVLDEALEPVPQGAAGELYVGGAGLARGYLRQPGLTAQRFVADPFSGQGARMFRTGDRVRYRADGNLEFIGRSDRQIKLRGQRIEPAEVEAALLRHPHVRQAVVQAHAQEEGPERLVAFVTSRTIEQGSDAPERMQFSLFYFGTERQRTDSQTYRLLLESARKADRLGLTAIWTPERHFTDVGSAYSNPSLLSAALAMVTQRIQLRAGSVVLPLHDPIRVAEEWAMVDQLSGGRVGIAVAPGWVPDDFVLAADAYSDRHRILWESLSQVRSLWRGETLHRANGVGASAAVRSLPRPVQSELPVWVTVGGNPDAFVQAGSLGFNVLTALLTLTIEELAHRLTLYRNALRDNGHDPDTRTVTVMLHTFVAETDEAARRHAHGPLLSYFRAHTEMRDHALRHLRSAEAHERSEADGFIAEGDVERMIEPSVERYLQTASLIGSPASCGSLVRKLKRIGVAELACLIDFGIDSEVILENLEHLAQLAHEKSTVLDVDSLREHLKSTLPEYMVPADIVPLSEVPLTPTGKIDTRALRDLGTSQVHAQRTASTAPRTPLEKALADIWMEVLKIPAVGVEDDFFHIGGHSLSAVRVAARVRDEFGVSLPLWTLFRMRTLGAMAETIVADMIGANAQSPGSPSALSHQMQT